ncbi:glucose 1-dehydrogenase [Candidatus Marimicrobium litorale]|uniref:Glucose 1-dehydrogenase n=1 Tax=Candidatus Marimicrobium litorale TaxID=2518991 RepID=A0ABT3T8P5_9GAMM|nr:glucose 1-dehydrogenase [Candidatus Marimicrobium litorale]MCX2978424.1 glucose 1-dehydrogenase [Candidatus Marimicrobium litorale]
MSLMDKFRLDGKTAIVTGAGKGIGAGIAIAFAEAGADLIIGARTEEDLNRVAGDIEALGRRALVVPTDVLDYAQLQNLADRAMAEFGRIDILVNNAGGFPPKPVLETSAREFEGAFRFNVSTAFEMSRICAPLMKDSGSDGNILNISSVAGHKPTPCFAAYGTAKGALSLLTQELAQEFAPYLRVNAIAVGSTKTDALNTVLSPEIEQTMVELTPMARLGEVEDIALGALYLCTPAASYVTGEILAVNGGLERLNMQMPRAWGGMG